MDSASLGARVGSAAFAVGLGLAIVSNPAPAVAEESDSGRSANTGDSRENGESPGRAESRAISGAAKPPRPSPSARTRFKVTSKPQPNATTQPDATTQPNATTEPVTPDLAVTGDPTPPDSGPANIGRARTSSRDSDRGAVEISTALGPEMKPSGGDPPGSPTRSVPTTDVPDTIAGEVAASVAAVTQSATDGGPAAAAAVSKLPAPAATVAVPQAAAAAEPAGILSGFLSIFGLGAPAGGTGLPPSPFAFVTAALELVRRELQRLFANQAPSAAPTVSGQTIPGVITGSLNASDPEGDPLAYRLTQAPERGAVVVDAAGNFTYTPGEALAASGGTDTFIVEVRDTGFRLNFWSPTTTKVPVAVVVDAVAPAPAPVVVPALSIGPASKVEGNAGTSNLGFTVSLSAASNSAVTVGYSTSNGTATAGQDYVATSGTVTFNAGETSKTVNVAVNGDTTIESDETFTVTLSNPAGASIATPTATGTIVNDDVAPAPVLPTVSIADLSVSEGNGDDAHFMFTVSLSTPSESPVTVRYSTSNGTATAGQDYLATSDSITFAPGVTSQMVHVDIIGDTVVEPNETFTVTLSSPSGATIVKATATGTIVNDDVAGPGAGTGTIYDVTTSGPDIIGFDPAKDKLNLGDVSVHDFIVVDTAQGVGFRSPWTGETSIVQGVSLGQLTIDSFTPVINDHLRQDLSGALAWEHGIVQQPDTVYARSHEVGQIDRVEFDPSTDVVDFRYFGTREQIYLVDSPEGVIISNAGTGQALILQGVTKSELRATNFVFHPAQVREDALNTQLGIGPVPDSQVLPQGVPVAGTNNWPTGVGNGAPPSGQTGTTTVISWQWGTHTQLAFDPATDRLDFGWFKPADFDVTEEGGSTRVEIVGGNQSYTLTGVAINQLRTTNIIALDDGTRTKWQNIIFGAGQPVSLPAVSVSDTSVVEGDSGTSTMAFTVTLSKPAAEAVSVSYSTSNGSATAAESDYVPAVGTLTFAAGETSKTINVTVNGDTLIETDEYLTLSLSAPVQATISRGTATGTIVNDDIDQAPAELPTVSIADLSVDEGNGEHAHFMFMVSLSKASESPVTVGYSTSNGTAIAGQDYTAASGTLTFAPGVTTQMVHVDVLGDSIVEPDETFTVTLSGPSGATIARGTATGRIRNDDTADPGESGGQDQDPGSAEVSFLKSTEWGSGFNGAVTVTNTGEQALSDWRVSFDFDGTISSIWNATVESRTGNTYLVKPTAWNSTVAAGDSVSFGFTATGGTPTNFVLSGTADPGTTPQPTGPQLSVTNTSVQEGNSGTRDLVFNVALSKPSAEAVTVGFRTEDFTAAAGSDYLATEGTLTFAAGETAKEVRVTIYGDQTYEGNESLILVLSGVSGATLAGDRGVGLIVNDDANPNAGIEPEYRVIGYFAEWGVYGRNYHVSDIPADRLTDINYAFANINSNGEVVLFDSFAAVERSYPGDTWDQAMRGSFNQLAKLKEENPDVNVLISIGGWTLSDKFSDVALTAQSRERFAASAITFMTTYGFDGIDLDWEYPVGGGLPGNTYRPEDTANYTLLVQEIRRQLDLLEATDGVDERYLLTIAGPAGYDKIQNYDLDGMAPHLDWFQVMTYDLHGSWEAKTGHQAGLYANPNSDQSLYNVDAAINLYLQQVDPSKIVLGSPMYGRSWQGVPDGGTGGLNQIGTGAGVGTYEPGVIDYWHIVDLTKQQPDMYHVYWDDVAKAPYVYSTINGGTFITYEDPRSLQYKLDYIKELGLGGVMFWELDSDVRDVDDPDSLLGLAARELLGEGSNNA